MTLRRKKIVTEVYFPYTDVRKNNAKLRKILDSVAKNKELGARIKTFFNRIGEERMLAPTMPVVYTKLIELFITEFYTEPSFWTFRGLKHSRSRKVFCKFVS